MKKILVLLLLLQTGGVLSQDSIVNFLDIRGKISTKDKAVTLETVVKKGERNWELTRYYANGIPKIIGHYASENRTTKKGRFQYYSDKGLLTGIVTYDSLGQKDGKTLFLFKNKKVSHRGIYKKNKKEGIWKYYHFNGNLAARLYYKADSMYTYKLWNDEGALLNEKLIFERKPKFKGGDKKFRKLIVSRGLYDKLSYSIKGKLFVRFIIGVTGKIEDVQVFPKVKEELRVQITDFFYKLPDWEPAIQLNRKVRVSYTIPLNFSHKRN